MKIKSEIKIYSRVMTAPRTILGNLKQVSFFRIYLAKTTEHIVWQKTGLHCRAHLLHFTGHSYVRHKLPNIMCPHYRITWKYHLCTHTRTQTISEKTYMELVTLDASGRKLRWELEEASMFPWMSFGGLWLVYYCTHALLIKNK